MSAQPDTPKCLDQDTPKRQCIVISLIRHAQCESNANRSWIEDDGPNPLTDEGRLQAKKLGENWEDTRIDYLLSSPRERALCTANALSDHNKCHPEVVINPVLVERRYGRKVVRLMNSLNYQDADEALTGQSYYCRLPVSRYHSPDEGGESLAVVAMRAEAIIRMILNSHGVKLSEAPEFMRDKKTTTTPAKLPDGIPHVVIVSHNVFLMELYEKLYSWGKDHVDSKSDWKNTSWSRHILWYDEDTEKMDVFDMKFCGSGSSPWTF